MFNFIARLIRKYTKQNFPFYVDLGARRVSIESWPEFELYMTDRSEFERQNSRWYAYKQNEESHNACRPPEKAPTPRSVTPNSVTFPQ